MTQTSISFPFHNLQGTAISRALKLLLFFFIAASLFCQSSSLTMEKRVQLQAITVVPACSVPLVRRTEIRDPDALVISPPFLPLSNRLRSPISEAMSSVMLLVIMKLLQPTINALKEIQVFLEANHSEIVTIFIEDYVASPQGLTKVFKASGLNKYWFPVSRMPKNGEDWPIVDDMIKKNQRLVVFTSKKSKEASEGIAYEWRYVVENQYGNGGLKFGSCPSRSESSPMNTKTILLVLQNYFPDNPNMTAACADNSAPLLSMTNTCYEASGKRWSNFIAVDFYQRNDVGGASEAVDHANGHLTCNCDSIAYCKIAERKKLVASIKSSLLDPDSSVKDGEGSFASADIAPTHEDTDRFTDSQNHNYV
nr:PI-PLC X domain-containing protein At5g67130-like [Ipomoea batatas]